MTKKYLVEITYYAEIEADDEEQAEVYGWNYDLSFEDERLQPVSVTVLEQDKPYPDA